MKNYPLFRMIHRVLVLVMVTSTLVMATSGILLKYPKLANWIEVNQNVIRNLHNQISIFFTIVLLAMTISGFMMYIIPLLVNRKKHE